MTSLIQQPELQQRTLRLYGELLCRRNSWARELVFAAFPGAAHCGLAAAASLVGAVSLVVDSDAPSMKAHFRDGAFDFIVNTLDEALRAIKNEIRKGTPLSIGLIADPQIVIAEAVERGLCASLVVSKDAVQSIASADAELVDVHEASTAYRAWLSKKNWMVAEIAGSEASTDPAVQEWMHKLAAHQRSVRGRDRWTWLPVPPAETA